MYQVYAGVAPGPNVGASGAFADDAWQELAVVAPAGIAGSSVTATLYKNGSALISSAVLVAALASRQSNMIGTSNLSADPLFKGDIAALIVFARALAPVERQTLDDHLKKKWAF